MTMLRLCVAVVVLMTFCMSPVTAIEKNLELSMSNQMSGTVLLCTVFNVTADDREFKIIFAVQHWSGYFSEHGHLIQKGISCEAFPLNNFIQPVCGNGTNDTDSSVNVYRLEFDLPQPPSSSPSFVCCRDSCSFVKSNAVNITGLSLQLEVVGDISKNSTVKLICKFYTAQIVMGSIEFLRGNDLCAVFDQFSTGCNSTVLIQGYQSVCGPDDELVSNSRTYILVINSLAEEDYAPWQCGYTRYDIWSNVLHLGETCELTCENGGTLYKISCMCKCASTWTGLNCEHGPGADTIVPLSSKTLGALIAIILILLLVAGCVIWESYRLWKRRKPNVQGQQKTMRGKEQNPDSTTGESRVNKKY